MKTSSSLEVVPLWILSFTASAPHSAGHAGVKQQAAAGVLVLHGADIVVSGGAAVARPAARNAGRPCRRPGADRIVQGEVRSGAGRAADIRTAGQRHVVGIGIGCHTELTTGRVHAVPGTGS